MSPLPRKRPPVDPPEVVRARRPDLDMMTVLMKTSHGDIVAGLPLGTMHRWPDGSMKVFAPWGEPVAPAIAKELRNAVAETYEFMWVGKYDTLITKQQGLARWRLVKKSENMVHCPFASQFGDDTDDNIHLGDMLLHYRSREFGDQVRRGKMMLHTPQRIIQDGVDKAAENVEEAVRASGKKSSAAKTLPTTFEPTETPIVRSDTE